MASRTTFVRFGVRVHNGDAALSFSPKGGKRRCRGRRIDRYRSLTVCENLAFRNETLQIPLEFDTVCSVDAAAPARVVARLGDVYRARVAWMQRFVDSHTPTQHEKEKLARIIAEAKAKGVKGRLYYDVKVVA